MGHCHVISDRKVGHCVGTVGLCDGTIGHCEGSVRQCHWTEEHCYRTLENCDCQATTVVGKMTRMGHRINVIGC